MIHPKNGKQYARVFNKRDRVHCNGCAFGPGNENAQSLCDSAPDCCESYDGEGLFWVYVEVKS